MESLSLNGRVAIITGSSSGLGEAAAVLLAKRGAKVAIHGRSESKLEAVSKKILSTGTSADKVLIVTGDITDAAVRKRLVEKTVEKFGKLDILVNNAGMARQILIKDLTEEDLDYHLNLLLKSQIFMTQAALPYLVKSKGNIINISTGLTEEPLTGFCAYAATKAALDHFSKIAAIEFGKSGIRVNTVSPGAIPTQGIDDIFGTDKKAAENFLASQARKTVLGWNGTPDDIAESIAFLASDAAKFLSGATINVDGGRRVYPNSGERDEAPDLSDIAK